MGDWRLDCASVLDRLVTSCCVVTAAYDDLANGCLVASVMPVGVTEPLIAFALGRQSFTHHLASRSGHVAVHLLGEDDVAIARLFGRASADGAPKLDGTRWHRGATGAPIITACSGVAEARIIASAEVREHVVHVAEVVYAATFGRPPAPLTIAKARESDLEAPRLATDGSQRG